MSFIEKQFSFGDLQSQKDIYLRVCKIVCHACLSANVVYVPKWFCARVVYVPARQHVKSVPTSHFYVPTCQKTCQHFIRRINVSTWRAIVPSGVPIFQLGVSTHQKVCQFLKHSSNEILKENFYTLLLQNIYYILNIIVAQIHHMWF